MVLDDGTSLKTDLLIYATGYRIAPNIFSPSDAAYLGLPVPVSQVPPAEVKKWIRLDTEADEEVCRLFPRLSTPPTPLTPPTPPTPPPPPPPAPTHQPQVLLPPIRGRDEDELTPHRLYRTILPPSLLEADDRSFAVVGAIAVSATGIVAEAVALWTVAWLTEQLDVKGKRAVQEVEREIALVNAFKARRYLELGRRTPTVMYEWLSVRMSVLSPLTTLIHVYFILFIYSWSFGFILGLGSPPWLTAGG